MPFSFTGLSIISIDMTFTTVFKAIMWMCGQFFGVIVRIIFSSNGFFRVFL